MAAQVLDFEGYVWRKRAEATPEDYRDTPAYRFVLGMIDPDSRRRIREIGRQETRRAVERALGPLVREGD